MKSRISSPGTGDYRNIAPDGLPIFPKFDMRVNVEEGGTAIIIRAAVRVTDDEGNVFFTRVVSKDVISARSRVVPDPEQFSKAMQHFNFNAYLQIFCGKPDPTILETATKKPVFVPDSNTESEYERLMSIMRGYGKADSPH